MATVYLGLGGNMGDRLANLKQALVLLSAKLCIEQVSSVYETEPQGYAEQPMFLNAALRARTGLPAAKLLKFIKSVEKKLGRIPSFRNAPRPADIDILFYDRDIIRMKELVVPHPRLKERAFVLVPLAEIAAEMTDPESGLSIKELEERLETLQGVTRWCSAEELFPEEQRCIS